jgi:RecA-family ATPase
VPAFTDVKPYHVDLGALTDLYTREITEGMGATTVRAGLIKCATGEGSIGAQEEKMLRAAGRANRAFRLAASGCHHAKNAMGAFYRRIQSRAGGGKAVVATARKIAERVYRLLKYGEAYTRQAMTDYENAYRIKLTKGLARKAADLGYKLVEEPISRDQLWACRGFRCRRCRAG